MKHIRVYQEEGLKFLEKIPSNSVDLILTDPPYITSRDSGMDKWVEHVAKQDEEGAASLRTVEEWRSYKTDAEWIEFFKLDSSAYEIQEVDGKKQRKYKAGYIKRKMKNFKNSFQKYGSIYGKKYAVTTDYGAWDSDFTIEKLGLFIKEFYRVLRPGGTCIVFFDLWKITHLKDALEARSFKQLRFIEWIKTNPQPINSGCTYLSNCREIALTAVKGQSSTFNSRYDNGIYRYPIYNGKKGLDRFHPTQKSLKLFEDLIRKHSSEGDLVLDCFLGSGTTALAAHNENRRFIGCELDEEYYNKTMNRLKERAL